MCYAPKFLSLPDTQADGWEGTHFSLGSRRKMDGVPLSGYYSAEHPSWVAELRQGASHQVNSYSCDQRLELRAEVHYQGNGSWVHVI